jgi:hypothetical protein
VAGVWVTLHRVGQDAAGPVDSVRTAADGGFAFRYRPTGRPDAVYFVAASQGGVAYFAPPLRAPDVRGEAAEVVVFDTTSRPVRLTVRGRHLIVAAPDTAGVREVLEVFELSNDSSVTAVPPAGTARGVWSTPLPPGVRALRVRESGDVPGDGLTVVGGAATLLVPVAPGIKQVAFSYGLPAGGVPLALPVASAVGLLEVLVEERGGTASGAGLAAVAPVALEGKSFRRFLAQDAPAGATITVATAEPATRSGAQVAVPVLIVVLGGGMVAALVLAGRRRAPPLHVPAPALRVTTPAATTPPAADSPRERLLRQLAELDDEFARRRGATAVERADYENARARLRAELGAQLNAELGEEPAATRV